MMFDIKELKAPNEVQQEAIMKSLTEPFSLIQGPPGTGKTVTAVRLAYLFQRLNRNLPAKYEREKIRPQVMICGPSNKSVDVVAGNASRYTHVARTFEVDGINSPYPNSYLDDCTDEHHHTHTIISPSLLAQPISDCCRLSKSSDHSNPPTYS
jgi:DNA polymerase III delta prime subunit